jgi:hypothetical protein
MARIHAAPHPAMHMADTQHFGGEVRVTMHDGRTLEARVDRPLGRGPQRPLPQARLEAKYLDCATRVLEPSAARRALALVARFEELADVAELTRVLDEGSLHRDAAPELAAAGAV